MSPRWSFAVVLAASAPNLIACFGRTDTVFYGSPAGSTCASASDCTDVAPACINGACSPRAAAGGLCDDSGDCADGLQCDDGYCGAPTTMVYRSVGPGTTTALADGAANPMSTNGGVATFASALPDRIGVGDVLAYSLSSSIVDSVAFVSERLSSTQLRLQTSNGAPFAATSSNLTTWSLFRAYATLVDAVAGDENTGIPNAIANFDTWRDGNDLVSAGVAWNIACYADAVDIVNQVNGVSINGTWVTSADNYLRIFAPQRPADVGVSQRHAGAYDAGKYLVRRTVQSGNASVFAVFAGDVRIEGLQIVDASPSGGGNILVNTYGGDIRINANIMRSNPGASSNSPAIVIQVDTQPTVIRIWNNTFDGFNASAISDGLNSGSPPTHVIAESNTIYGCNAGLESTFLTADVRNNIFEVAADGACISATQQQQVVGGYNICNLAEAPIGESSASSSRALFVDAANADFTLSPNDVVARGKGVDLSSASDLAFATDLSGGPRTVPWNIGAN